MNDSGTSIWRRFDFILFGAVVLLVIYGVLMIRSATMGAIDPDFDQSRAAPDPVCNRGFRRSPDHDRD